MRLGRSRRRQVGVARLNLDRATLPAFRERVAEIGVDTPRCWGTMDATRMMRHLGLTLEMSLGLEKIEDTSIPIVRELAHIAFNRVFTNWPKGKLKGPDYLTPPPNSDFATEQATVLRLMDEFVATLEREPNRREVNPSLGAIPMTKWSRAHGVHIDHHLRQFAA